jgi:hypothetical protein
MGDSISVQASYRDPTVFVIEHKHLTFAAESGDNPSPAALAHREKLMRLDSLMDPEDAFETFCPTPEERERQVGVILRMANNQIEM